MNAGQGSEMPVMMQLGDCQFGLDSAAYQALARSTHWRWADLKRPGAATVLQYGGQDSDRIRLPGVIYPEWRGSGQQMSRLRQLADQGEPLLMVDGRGHVLGDWVIEHVEERQSVFAEHGVPRRIDFCLGIRRFERPLAKHTGVGSTLTMKQLGAMGQMMVGNVEPFGANGATSLTAFAHAAGIQSASSDRFVVVEDIRRDKRMARLQEKYRKLRHKWRDFRQKEKESHQAWDKRFRADVKLYMNGVDDLIKRVTKDAPGSKELSSVAGALRRAGETSGKLLKYAGQVNRILDNKLFAGVAQKHGDRIARLNRVTAGLAKARMKAESAATLLERQAERLGRKPSAGNTMPGSAYLDFLVEARLVSRESVEKCRRFHQRLERLTREVSEEELKEARQRAEEAAVRAGLEALEKENRIFSADQAMTRLRKTSAESVAERNQSGESGGKHER